MYCSSCGRAGSSGAAFCIGCGTRLSYAEVTELEDTVMAPPGLTRALHPAGPGAVANPVSTPPVQFAQPAIGAGGTASGLPASPAERPVGDADEDDRPPFGPRLVIGLLAYFAVPLALSASPRANRLILAFDILYGYASAIGILTCVAMMVPGLVGLALVPSAWGRRAPAAAMMLLGTLAPMLVVAVISRTTDVDWVAHKAAGWLVACGDVVMFAAWLVATRRRRGAFLWLVPVCAFACGVGLEKPPYVVYLAAALVLGLLAVLPRSLPRRAPVDAQPGAQVPARDDTSGLAVAAFVTVWFVTIAGIVLGHLALGDIRRTGRRGKGLAVAALVLGYTGIVAAAAFVAVVAVVALGGARYR